MLKESFIIAMLIAAIALSVTGFASASEDQTVGNNCADTECFEETAWAAQCQPGDYRFVDKGNWGTFVEYDVSNCNPVTTYPIFAGQTDRAGTLWVRDDVTYKECGECGPGYYGTIYIKYAKSSCSCKDGYSNGFTEYHLQVVDEVMDFSAVTTKKGNPIPGQFDYSEEYDGKMDDTGWIEVEVCGYDDCDVFIAAHSVMQWCGYPTPT